MSRHTITPYRRGSMWWARIPQVGKPSAQRSLGTTDQFKATEMCAFLVWLRGQRDGYLLSQVASGRCPIGDAFDAWHANKLDAFVAEWKKGSEDVNLEPYVAKWVTEMERVKKPQADTVAVYLRQVRSLIPEGEPFPKSRLILANGKPNKDGIKDWLSDKGESTGNRYHAALSSFCEFLTNEEDALPFNPARMVKYTAPSDNDEPVFLEYEDAMRVLNALEGEVRAYHALAAATGLERQSLMRLRRRHIDLDAKTVFASASKRSWRRRTAFVYWRWFDAWEVFTSYLKRATLLPDAPVFTLKPDYAYRQLKAACKALDLSEKFSTHTWRHTWAVRGARDNLDDQVIAQQLGHKDVMMANRVYKRFRVTRADFGVPLQNKVTNTTTAPEQPMTGGGAK